MTGFDFRNAKATQAKELIEDFNRYAQSWKPAGYDAEMALRTRYYLDQQEEDIREQLRERFPETHKEMVPFLLPITRNVIDEQARVFLETTKLDLVDESGNQIDSASDVAAWWQEVQSESGLHFKLKLANRFTRLLKSTLLRVGWDPRKPGLCFHLYLPHNIRVAIDPDYPTDLDMAYGVMLEVGSEQGLNAGPEARRYEFWCARPEQEQHLLLSGSGERIEIEGNESGDNPFKDAEGKAIVPLVAFLDQSEEFGLFNPAGQVLHLWNRAMNVIATDVHRIAEVQGFGQAVITTQAGHEPPQKIVMGPSRAMVLKEGNTATMLSPQPMLAELDNLISNGMKRGALLHSIPPGSVALDSRAASSGYALQLERLPLTELRKDQIEIYKAPMRRLWKVIAAVQNAYGDPKIPAGTDMVWKPGDVNVPVDPKERQDLAAFRVANNLSTWPRELADMHGISIEEATKLYEQFKEENGIAGDDEDARKGSGSLAERRFGAARNKLKGAEGEKPEATEEDAPEEKPAGKKAEPVKFFQYEIEGGLVTINEVRASKGLPPIKDGDLTLPQYRAKYLETFAKSTATQEGPGVQQLAGLATEE